ncbi:hypothetical protein ScPMuIL_018616 [Solemya velum]
MSGDIYAEQAKRLVDEAIEGAFLRLETSMSERERTFDSLKLQSSETASRQSTFIREEDYEISNITWLSIQDFSHEKAIEKIDEFVKAWDYEKDSWHYCIDFLGKDEFDYDWRHRFRVSWSIPTRRKPIPRATANVYFTFRVSKIKPKHHSVDVFYVFETNRLVHRPGDTRFREKWLKEVIESKVLMMQAVAF